MSKKEEKKESYVKPEWRDKKGTFIRQDKKDFGGSLQGKIDFCQHQIDLYSDRQQELTKEKTARNDPKAKLKLQVERRKKALKEAEIELAKLEGTSKK